MHLPLTQLLPDTKSVSDLMEIILGDAAVFNVKNAFERLHIEEVHLLQVLQLQGDAAQLFPHQRSEVEVQGLLGADGHAHQDAQELELKHVLVQAGRRVQEEPETIITIIISRLKTSLMEGKSHRLRQLEGCSHLSRL